MTSPSADGLQFLLAARDSGARDTAWSAFLEVHSSLILHVARSLGGDQDAAMDRYAFVVAALRQDDCRRLRAYLADGRGKFSTWLMVVVRRLCFDQHRQRYGRQQGETQLSGDRHAQRRHLADLLGGELELSTMATTPEHAPDEALLRSEQRSALERALARLELSDRLLLRFRFEDDLSVPEIARVLGEPSPFRLYRRLERILATVRQMLEEAGIKNSVG